MNIVVIRLVAMNGVRAQDNARIFPAAVLVRLTAPKLVFLLENAVTLIILQITSIAMVNVKHLLAVELLKLYVTLVMVMSAGTILIVATLNLTIGVQQAEMMVLAFLLLNTAVPLKDRPIAQEKESATI